MPRPGRPTTERAKDFKGTLRQLIRTMSHYKLPLAAAMLFAVLSTIFNIAGPKVLAKATTALATGWIARLRGTGSIDFVYIGRILLFLLGMYLLSSAFSFIQGWLMTGLSQRSATTSAARSVKRSTACRWRTLKSAPWARCSPASPTMWTRWDRA